MSSRIAYMCDDAEMLISSSAASDVAEMSISSSVASDDDNTCSKLIAMDCEMVGGGADGTLNLCGRVCLVNENEEVIFHSYVKPIIDITNYRYPFSVNQMMVLGISCDYCIEVNLRLQLLPDMS